MTRSELNKKIGALAFGILRLPEDVYRSIVVSIDPKSEGHVTRCDDETANLVLIALRRVAEKFPPIQKNVKQHKFIARLMIYLGWTWKNTADFCRHQTGKNSTRSCTAFELSKIINGMIAIIDQDIFTGKLQLSTYQLSDYQRHTKRHREIESEKSAICDKSEESQPSTKQKEAV